MRNKNDPKYTDFFDPKDISVEGLWKLFAAQVYPTVSPDSVQYEHTRRCFYAGFIECFKVMNDLSTELSEDAASEHLSRINRETREFFEKDLRSMFPERGN